MHGGPILKSGTREPRGKFLALHPSSLLLGKATCSRGRRILLSCLVHAHPPASIDGSLNSCWIHLGSLILGRGFLLANKRRVRIKTRWKRLNYEPTFIWSGIYCDVTGAKED